MNHRYRCASGAEEPGVHGRCPTRGAEGRGGEKAVGEGSEDRARRGCTMSVDDDPMGSELGERGREERAGTAEGTDALSHAGDGTQTGAATGWGPALDRVYCGTLLTDREELEEASPNGGCALHDPELSGSREGVVVGEVRR